MLDKIILTNEEFKNKAKNYGYKIIVSIIIIIITLIIANIVKNIILNKLIEKEMNNKNNNKKIFYTLFSKIVYYIIIFIGIVIALINLGYQLSTIFIVLGSIGFAIALAIQGSITQIISGIIILLFEYYDIGDLILCNGITGYITDFNLLTTTLKDQAGIKIIVPNSTFTTSPFTNYNTNKDVLFKLFLTLSSNNKINFDILFKNIKNAIMNESKYVTNKNGVYITIFDIQGSGTIICVNIPIKSIDYINAGNDARLIVRRVLSDDNVLLLDNSYVANSSSNYS